MRFYFVFTFLLIFSFAKAQDAQLAYQYLRNGEYEKAAPIYKELQGKNTYNSSYLIYLITCYQELKQFSEVEQLIASQLKSTSNQEFLYVYLGYNYQLQYQQNKAQELYNKALETIETKPVLGYLIGRAFQDFHLLDYALNAYQKTATKNPNANFNFQIAAIYGEKGEIETMFNTYLDLIDKSENYTASIKNSLSSFITSDPENKYNLLFKQLVLKRSQNNPKNSFNQLLSWLYVQQKEFNKALIQEKALFNRNVANLQNIMAIGTTAMESSDFSASKACFNFVLTSSNNQGELLNSKLKLLEIEILQNNSPTEIENKFQELLSEHGVNANTIPIQTAFANFLAFSKNDTPEGIRILQNALELPLDEFQNGMVKLNLADLYVFNQQFSRALILYTQVQTDLKNHTLAQTARFKIAQTSYFNGDFEWAQTQLKVLKQSTSQLIANDALDLDLFITDNSVKDSLKLGLKKYAKAELLAYQNKTLQAIDTLQTLQKMYKGHPIEDEALFKQAKLFEKTKQFHKAEENYLKIISLNNQDILADDAIFNLAELYENKLLNKEKAMEYYKKIVFEYPSSIFLVEARKKFRYLRGENLN